MSFLQKNFCTKIYHAKVSLHENFQIYSICKHTLKYITQYKQIPCRVLASWASCGRTTAVPSPSRPPLTTSSPPTTPRSRSCPGHSSSRTWPPWTPWWNWGSWIISPPLCFLDRYFHSLTGRPSQLLIGQLVCLTTFTIHDPLKLFSIWWHPTQYLSYDWICTHSFR